VDSFHSIKELIRALDRDKDLLSEMFGKRNLLAFKYDFALEFANEGRKVFINYIMPNPLATFYPIVSIFTT